jgi:hypothetical protein
MASNSIFSLWNQGCCVVKDYPVAIILVPIVLNLLWNKFQPGLVKIPGPALAAYTKLWRLYNVYRGHAHLTAIDLHRKDGPLVRIAPNHVLVSDTKMIPVIYSNKEDFTKVGRPCHPWSIKTGRFPMTCLSLTSTTNRPASTRSNASRGRNICR